MAFSGVALCLVLLLHRNAQPLFCSLAALFALLPLPIFIPDRISIGGGSIFVSEIALLFVIGFTVHYGRSLPRSVVGVALLVFVVVVLSAIWGFFNGAAFADVWRDARGVFYTLGLGLGIASSLSSRPVSSTKIFLNSSYVVVVFSALVVLVETFAATSLFRIRSDEAVLYTPGGSGVSEASRLVPPGAMFCVIMIATLLGLWITMKARIRYPRIWWFVIPIGLLVVVLGFSRNFIVSIAVIMMMSLLLYRDRISSLLRLCRLLAVLSLVAGVLWYIISGISDKLKEVGYQTLDAFQDRVLNGLNPDVISVESSSAWRVTENSAALSSIAERPFGTGLGVYYRGPIAGEPFEGDYGLTYLHNAYLWIPVKLGILSTLVICIVLLLVVSSLFRRRGSISLSLKATQLAALGLAPVLLIAPVPFSRSGGVLCAALLGLYIFSVHIEGRGRTSTNALKIDRFHQHNLT